MTAVNSGSTSLSQSRPGCPEGLKSEHGGQFAASHFQAFSLSVQLKTDEGTAGSLLYTTVPAWTHMSPYPPSLSLSLLPFLSLLEALLNCDRVISITPQVATLCLISSLNRVAIIGIHFFPPLSSIPLQECGQVCGYELAQRWYVFI